MESRRSGVERRVREAWRTEPGSLLRLLSGLYGCAADTRNFLYDAEVIRTHRSPLPIVSIGGLTVGGSGKTPIAADLAKRLGKQGIPVAVLTHGYADEMDVHRRLNPGTRVYGGRNRVSLAERAAVEGAAIAILDSGFQYRRLQRDLEIVVLDETSLRNPVHRLPAGPYRDSIHTLKRAHLTIFMKREEADPADRLTCSRTSPGTRSAAVVLEELDLSPVLHVRLRPGRLVAANRAAEAVADPAPSAAVAGIMWPRPFFRWARFMSDHIEREIALPDHAPISNREATAIREAAQPGGIVCTLKDVSKLLLKLGEDAPIWYLSEELDWQKDGGAAVVQAALRLFPEPSSV
jgi:tetraacyldisaccharide 4'-kinase